MERDRQIRDLRALLDVSQAMSGEHSLDNLLRIIVRNASEVLEADRCSLFLYDEDKNELWSKIAGQLGGLREIRFPAGVGIAGTVASTREAANVPDAYADPRFNPEFDKKTGYRTGSVLCVPMVSISRKLIGVIQVLNKKGGAAFGSQDEALLGALGSSAAVALERARLTEAYIEKQRIDQTLKLAREIQMRLLPGEFPPFPNLPQLDLYAAIVPAKEVGGDFYDFFLLDDDHLFFAIGDVSGKGVPAALFMAVAKTLLKASARKGIGPHQVLSDVNAEICDGHEFCTLVTIFCGILNVRTGEVEYANAGHNPPLLVRPGEPGEFLSEGGGVVIGAIEGATYERQGVRLSPGDFLLLYTDGVTEAMNDRRELFSEDRLRETVRPLQTQASQQLIEGIMLAIKGFAQGMPQADDITMVSVKLKANESGEEQRLLAE